MATVWRRGDRGRESLAVRREGPPGLGGYSLAARGEREREPRSREGGASRSQLYTPTHNTHTKHAIHTEHNQNMTHTHTHTHTNSSSDSSSDAS